MIELWISVLSLVRRRWVHVNHVLGETGDMLVGWHVEFLLYFITVIYNAHSEVVGVRPLAADDRNVLVVVLYLLYFVENCVLGSLYIGKELLDVRQLQNRYLVVILLYVRVVVGVARRAQELVLLPVLRVLALLASFDPAIFDKVEVARRTKGLLAISFYLAFLRCRL